MNAGVWLGLKIETAAWADRYGSVWVVCGPVCYNRTSRETIGDPGEMLEIVLQREHRPQHCQVSGVGPPARVGALSH